MIEAFSLMFILKTEKYIFQSTVFGVLGVDGMHVQRPVDKPPETEVGCAFLKTQVTKESIAILMGPLASKPKYVE